PSAALFPYTTLFRSGDVVGWHVGEEDRLLLQRALADEALAQPEAVGEALALAVRVRRAELQDRGIALLLHHEERAVVRGDQRSELAHDQAGDRVQVLLPLHHRGELRQIRLE